MPDVMGTGLGDDEANESGKRGKPGGCIVNPAGPTASSLPIGSLCQSGTLEVKPQSPVYTNR